MATTLGCNHHLENVEPITTTTTVDNSTAVAAAAAAAPPPPPPSENKKRGRPRKNTTSSLPSVPKPSPPSSKKLCRPRKPNPAAATKPIPPDDGDRCKRNGGGGWRCPNPRIPGKIFCDKHQQMMIHRKELARAAKNGVVSSPAPAPAPAPAIPPVVQVFSPTACPNILQVGEIWALPEFPSWEARAYARIDRFIAGTGRVELTPLVPDSQVPGRILACSTFRIIPGQTSIVKPINCLSHRVASSLEAAVKSSFDIFPNAGEVWAVYNDLEPDAACHLAEIVSGYTEVSGVTTAPLVPAPSIGFNREMNGGHELRLTYFRKDLLWFSHQVPAIRTEEDAVGSGVGMWQVFSS